MSDTAHSIIEYNRRRRRLIERIKRRYPTRVQRIEMGRVGMDFVRIADPDWVLDQAALAEDQREKQFGRRLTSDELHLPYWAELWDSALAIGHWLSQRADAVRGWRVLDLGCGMGLSGAVAARLGARVVLADLEPDALLFGQVNAGVGAPRVRTRQLNWKTARLGERFDLILGADILYERTQWAPLEAFWKHHLAAGGRIVLGEPGRQTGDAFPAWLDGRAWKLETLMQNVAGHPTPMRLFCLHRAIRIESSF